MQGGDRTGAVSNGEWLHINGAQWDEIDEILVFAFIYEGVPNWDSTDGVVNIAPPDLPPIETRLTEGQKDKGMCAIAKLKNCYVIIGGIGVWIGKSNEAFLLRLL